MDQIREIARTVRESELGDKGELESSDEYDHVIQGVIPPPQTQYTINSAAGKEIGETIKELPEQGIIRKLPNKELECTNAPLQAVLKPDGSKSRK